MIKRTIGLILTAALLLLAVFQLPVYAAEPTQKSVDSQILRKYVDSINNKDWLQFTELFTADAQESFKAFFSNKENERAALGIYNVQSAKLIETKQLPEELLKQISHYTEYQQKYQEVSGFLVGVDYEVKSENKYFFKGENIHLAIIGKEGGVSRIIELSDAPLEEIIPKGLGFANKSESDALKIIKARIQGNIIGHDGSLIESQNAGSETMKAFSVEDHVAPATIRVYRVSLGQSQTVNFVNYVENVLPNEWIPSWPIESLRAGAMAAKMYGWYHVYHPKWPSLGADVKDTTADQVYVPGSELSSTNQAVADVGTVALQNSNGNVFEAQYLAGTPGSYGTIHSGKMMQYGTKEFATNTSNTYIDMCHYYYDYSDKSSGPISTFSYGVTITVDNADSANFTASANWFTGATNVQKYGTDYRYIGPQTISDAAWFKANIPATGTYQVYAWWPEASTYNTSTPFIIAASTGNVTVNKNQTASGGQWNLLGSYSLNAGEYNVVGVSRWTSTTGYVIADAIKIVQQ